VAGYVGFTGLGVEGVFTHVLDNVAQSILILADELGVFFLFFEQDARLVLLPRELAFQVGNASPYSRTSALSSNTGQRLEH
jgi:hypothetical protein